MTNGDDIILDCVGLTNNTIFLKNQSNNIAHTSTSGLVLDKNLIIPQTSNSGTEGVIFQANTGYPLFQKTYAPSSANRSAIARPMPEPPPVMSACLPWRRGKNIGFTSGR